MEFTAGQMDKFKRLGAAREALQYSPAPQFSIAAGRSRLVKLQIDLTGQRKKMLKELHSPQAIEYVVACSLYLGKVQELLNSNVADLTKLLQDNAAVADKKNYDAYAAAALTMPLQEERIFLMKNYLPTHQYESLTQSSRQAYDAGQSNEVRKIDAQRAALNFTPPPGFTVATSRTRLESLRTKVELRQQTYLDALQKPENINYVVACNDCLIEIKGLLGPGMASQAVPPPTLSEEAITLAADCVLDFFMEDFMNTMFQDDVYSKVLGELALERGEKTWGRSKITFVGHGGAGKTGTERSMMGYEFEHTESTVGINNDLVCELLSELANVGDEDGLQLEGDMLWTKAERAEKEYENAVAKVATAIKKGRLKAEADKRKLEEAEARRREFEALEAMEKEKKSTQSASVGGVAPKKKQQQAHVAQVPENIGEDSGSTSILPGSISGVDAGSHSVAAGSHSVAAGGGGSSSGGNKLLKPLSASVETEFDTAEYLKMLAKDLQMNSKLLINLFDFGGQEIFGAVTPLFMTRYGVYVLVFNMECFLITPEDMSKNDPKRGMISWEECTKVMKQWLNSIVVHTSYEEGGSMRTAPIFIVGTHRDLVSSSAHHQSISSAISSILHEDHPAFGSIKKNDREGLIYYPVDNTLGRLDPTMKFLMKNIESVIEKEDYVLVTKSLTWFRLLDKINGAPRSFLRYSEVVAFAKECGITKSEAVDEMLEYFHEFGAVLWHKDPGTRDVVIKDPVTFLVKPSANIICQHTATATDPTVHKLPEPIQLKIDTDGQHKKDFSDMKTIGRISHRLLECLLSEGEHSEYWEIVKLLMIKYGLLVPLRREEGEGKEKTDLKYLVPALLSEGARDDSDVVIGHRFYFHFSATLSSSSDDCLRYSEMREGFLPGGLFVRLIGKVLGWSQDTTLSKTKNWTCHKHWMTVFFGPQEFRLTYLVDYNAIQVDIVGQGTPIAIHARLRNILDTLIKEHFKSLKMVTLLTYDDEGVCQGSIIRPLSALRPLLVPLTSIRTAMKDHCQVHFGDKHPGKKFLSEEEVLQRYEPWHVVTRGKKYNVFVSYRWKFQDNVLAGKYSMNGIYSFSVSCLQYP